MHKLFWLAGLIPTFLANVHATTLLDETEPRFLPPAFELTDLSGTTWSTETLKGQPVLINFWATWCPPCIEEMPSLDSAREELKADVVPVLAINYQEEESLVAAFRERYELELPIMVDTTGEVVRSWPIKSLPTTLILDAEGKVAYQVIGKREWDADEILDAVRALKP